MALGKECPTLPISPSPHGGFVTLAPGAGRWAFPSRSGCGVLVGPSLPSPSLLSQFVKMWEIMSKVSIGKDKKIEQSANGQKVSELPLPMQTYLGRYKASCL